ncbi:MAG: DUF4406 domain-containing protein [Bacteroidetes bacterium]|nr:DUF4406 domain-containing protein [Bacteroidota bacterium]
MIQKPNKDRTTTPPKGDKIKDIYLAGKVTGIEYEKCLRKFDVYELLLKSSEYNVTNPMHHISKHASWEEAMEISMELLKTCDAIFLIKDWINSKGAKQELIYALQHDYEIITNF